MSLLREIQDAAINSHTDLAMLLRKCKVLAARLGNPEFKNWVENELSGYEDVEILPKYRLVKVNSKGHFSGPFQSGLRNADIPMSCIPKEFHKKLSYAYFTLPVAAMEDLVKKSDGSLQEPWNADIVAFVGQDIYESMNCMQAWKVIPSASIVAALDAVRNSILNFVLEIEAESPDAGEAALNSSPIPQEKLHQIFNTYITGDVQNIATGSHSFDQKVTNGENNTELFSKMLDALRSLNHPEITMPLSESIEEMRYAQGTNKFKIHYKNFMSLLSDHIQVLGPIVAPYLPTLATLLP